MTPLSVLVVKSYLSNISHHPRPICQIMNRKKEPVNKEKLLGNQLQLLFRLVSSVNVVLMRGLSNWSYFLFTCLMEDMRFVKFVESDFS